MIMSSMKWFQLSAILSALLLGGCGARNSGTPGGDTISAGDSDGGNCSNGTDCRSGVCSGGFCVPAATCTTQSDCPTGKYCHFIDPPTPWVPGTQGTCSDACTNEDSCGLSQLCINRHCYTNIDCVPAQNSCDCPPGEACSARDHTCTAPQSTCYFDEQCPCLAARWHCTADHTCIDPDQLAHCTTAANCDNTPGCSVGACECFDGACRVAGACNPSNEYKTPVCGTGKYCATNRCQTATACPATAQDSTGQATCTPYGLVCKSGYCVNPPPCDGTSPNYNCTAYGSNWTCHTNTTPPTCSPGAECVRHEQCAAPSYCDPTTSKCLPGCRDDATCQTLCPGSTEALCSLCAGAQNCDYCEQNRKCGTTPSTSAQCETSATCQGGYACALDDPSMDGALTCQLMGTDLDGNPCSKTCHMICDTLVNLIPGMNTCPTGQKCGGGSALTGPLSSLLGYILGTGGALTTSSVCYVPPTTTPTP